MEIDTRVFDVFDIMSDGTGEPRLDSVTRQARALLTTRDRVQVEYATKAINWMVRQPTPPLTANGLPRPPTQDPLSVVDTLLERIDLFDLGGEPIMRNAKWSEYFAALALAMVAAAYRRYLLGASTVDPAHPTTDHSPIGAGVKGLAEHLALATNALMAAQWLRREEAVRERVSAEAQRTISLAGKETAILAHADKIELEFEFLEFYHAHHGNPPCRPLAREFLAGLRAEKRKVPFSDGNALRTLCDALKAFKRGNRPRELLDKIRTHRNKR